jgi:hypothetical protein
MDIVGDINIDGEYSAQKEITIESLREVIMVRHAGFFLVSMLIGLIALAVAFSASIYGQDQYTLPSLALFFFSAGLMLAMRLPEERWVIAAGVPLPVIGLVVWTVEPGTRLYSFGICVGFLLLAALGAIFGQSMSRKTEGIRRWTGISATVATIFVMALMGYLASRPQPLSGDKMAFAGHWKSESGVELSIDPAGFCTFALDPEAQSKTLGEHYCGDFASSKERLLIRIDDTEMRFIQPMNLSFGIKIDRPPYQVSTSLCMNLEGMKFTKIS